MIAHLRGRVTHRDAGAVVVDVAGVGYLVHVTPGERLPARGGEVELHTSLQVREESMTLYGFSQRASLRLFELLLGSSGVGPKLALAALATHPPDVLRMAIAAADVPTLTQVPGVGKKVAERLVLELRDKVGGPLGAEGDGPGAEVSSEGAGPSGDTDLLGEVRDALLALGYSTGEIQGVLAQLRADDLAELRDLPTDAATGELLRRALRQLGRGALDGAR